ncbi:MAG: LacI family DNA-binding transcriptional regulator [Lachnospiraceae bacterium]|nr:LacI family DNA-binding transcriptional regulator [Lachnospiraceae bacterium]
MENEKKRYTIEDIARELGISKTTVSRAISGKGRISKETTERVMQFIAQHDYRPNVMAKGLAQSRTYNLGFVLPEEYGAAEFPFFRECMNGICQVACAANYDVVISMTEGLDISQLRRMIANRKVDGMILSRTMTESATQKFLREKGVPFVVIGPSENPEVVNVDNDNEGASRELTGIMLMKGMRRLALIGGSRRHLVTESRRRGFAQAHREQGIYTDEALNFMDVDNYLKAMHAVNKSLEYGADGIVCMDDFITGLVLGCLREKGIRIPEEIRIASLYDSAQLEYNTPSVTSLRFDTKELGRRACRTLLEMLGETVAEEENPLSYQVILRESTKA